MFRTKITSQTGDHLAIKDVGNDVAEAAMAYRDNITAWVTSNGHCDPDLALVLVPRTEHFETLTPYYEAKAAFANLGVPTQMVTSDLLSDERQFGWSVANIALASFAKLGGVPWTVEAPATEQDLVIGVGCCELGSEGQRRRSFGYAVSFISNGVYHQTWSFTPTADSGTYKLRLRDAVQGALSEDLDTPPRRLVIHLAKNTGPREIDAVNDAIAQSGVSVPVAYLRLDDSSMWDLADTSNQTFIPAKGTVTRLGDRRALLQSEGENNLGPPDGPLLIALDRRSTVEPEDFDDLVAQAFRLAHANWRGFNARSKPATLVYGEQLASLVGHLADVKTWNPDHLRSELKTRPWFL
ncbi:MAG: Piwi domain-containing protein [Pseudonocardiaceae bacterium]